MLGAGLWSSLTELNCRPSPYHGDALPTELREQTSTRTRLYSMPASGGHENLFVCLSSIGTCADTEMVWIDRIISDSSEGSQVTDLHERLTLISSADAARRRAAFDRVVAALAVAPGTALEVRTEYGESISAHRTNEGTALFDTKTKLPVHADDRSLGVVGWLNNGPKMQQEMKIFHASPTSLRARVQEDADLIRLAQTRLDRLFDLADHITTAERAVAKVQSERSDLSESKRERESREQSLNAQLEAQQEGSKKSQMLIFGAVGAVVVGAALAILVNPIVGAGVCAVGVLLAVASKFIDKAAGDGEVSAEALEIQLGRVDELFDTQNLTRNRRSAEDDLAQSWEQWRSIAGDAQPSVLMKDRPRIEELAGHLELISHAQGIAPGDTSILVGFASLLAELNRRFPAERVPLLVDDLFHELAPQYHSLMRELLLRASHRRQVVLETADVEATKWAAVEAVGGSALVITDYDIDYERIIREIEEAVASDPTSTV